MFYYCYYFHRVSNHFCFTCRIFLNAWIVLAFIPLSIFFFELADQYALKEGVRIKERRKRFHLNKVDKYIDSGDVHEALEAIRKAKIYGALPQNILDFERLSTK